jgi:type IV pilus assembly protein PilB
MENRKKIGTLLVEAGHISNTQLEHALQAKLPNEKLGEYLMKEGQITEMQLIEQLEQQLGIPLMQLSHYEIEPNVIQLIPSELAKRALLLPVKIQGNKLYIAMVDPMNFFAIEEVRMCTGYQIEVAMATKDELMLAIMKYYDLQESVEAVMEDYSVVDVIESNYFTDEDSAVVRLVNNIITKAVAQRASDIHFDPQETELIVRYRVDGLLITERSLPKTMQSVVIARIKIMGNLNITEYRIPQDGRIKANYNGKPIDIRLSTLPTVYGEKVVMRILDLNSATNDLTKLGLREKNMQLFKQMIKTPNGIVLITGPTGSGKSSTLYAALKELNAPDVNIMSVEDPVEYQLQGINQIQVKEEVGLTFATGLRSMLRQDPDIIMLGEIRDLETAQIAVRASLTGHLVLSTLHTNNAVESITRMQDMGIEPFLLTASLVGIVAQRLVRRVCQHCRQLHPITPEEKIFLQKYGYQSETVIRGRGCAACYNSGYRGRIAIHEVIPITRELKDLILKKATSRELIEFVRKQGYESMIEDGVQKILNGTTSFAEVMRVAMED